MADVWIVVRRLETGCLVYLAIVMVKTPFLNISARAGTKKPPDLSGGLAAIRQV
jgi:hypothetical protein